MRFEGDDYADNAHHCGSSQSEGSVSVFQVKVEGQTEKAVVLYSVHSSTVAVVVVVVQ